MTSSRVKFSETDELNEHRDIFYNAQRSFCHYFLKYANSYRIDWAKLAIEYPNLLTAIQYYQEAKEHENLLILSDILHTHLNLQGYWRDGMMISEWSITAAIEIRNISSVARYQHYKANILNQIGEYYQAEQLYQTSEDTYLSLGEREKALESRQMRAMVVRAQGHLSTAKRLNESTIKEAKQLGMTQWLGHPLYVQALMMRDQGDFRRAEAFVEESLNLLADGDEIMMISQCYYFLGELALLQKNLSRAYKLLQISLQMSRKVNNIRGIAMAQKLLGDVLRTKGKNTKALELYSEAYSTIVQLGDRHQQARLLLSKMQLSTMSGNRQEAIKLAEKAVIIYQDIGDPRGEAASLFLITVLYLKKLQLRLALLRGVNLVGVILKAKLLRIDVAIGFIKRRGKW